MGLVCNPNDPAGRCVEATCRGLGCGPDQICNAVTGECEVDPCASRDLRGGRGVPRWHVRGQLCHRDVRFWPAMHGRCLHGRSLRGDALPSRDVL